MNIGIIGTGYVGLVSGTCFAEMGNQVLCIDNSPEKLKKLRNSEVTIYEPGLEVLFHRNIEKKRLTFSDDLKKAVKECKVIFLCLPTPQGEDGSADLQYVMKVADDIGKIMADEKIKDFRVIVNKSTVPVGTAGKVAGEITKHGVNNFAIVSNPEFLREGFAVEDFMRPDRIVIGSSDKKAFSIMRELYEPFVRQGNPILEMDTASSEVTKYAANSYLAMRITFMNQLANFCEQTGANIDLIRKGMGADNRIGKRFLFAGIGYGGAPKDVRALIKTSKDYNSELTIMSKVEEANSKQKYFFIEKILKHYDGNIKGKHFAVWGLAYKPNTPDIKEAPSIVIINELLKNGATVTAYDPAANETAKVYLKDTIKYANDEIEVLKNADALLILTEWNEFRNPDLNKLKQSLKSPVVFDGRNIFSPDRMKENGFTYYSVGRE